MNLADLLSTTISPLPLSREHIPCRRVRRISSHSEAGMTLPPSVAIARIARCPIFPYRRSCFCHSTDYLESNRSVIKDYYYAYDITKSVFGFVVETTTVSV